MIINNYFTIVLIISLICGGFMGYVGFIEEDFFEGIWCGTFVTIFMTFVLIIIGVLIDISMSDEIETNYTTETKLVALNDFISRESNVKGNFFLCINGSSSDTYNIRYATKDDSEVIKINTIEVNNDNIGFVEDDNIEVVITHKKIEYKYNKVGEWLFGYSIKELSDREIGYEFHIPKGSITNDIEVDLK